MATEAATETEGGAVEVDLVWWLVKLGRDDRETYRKLREIAWRLASENVDSSVLPNKLS